MSDLAPLPGETVRLYVRLEGLASLRGAEALVLWTPHGADADGYRLVGFGAPAGTDCEWLFRGQLGDLNQVTDSTAHLSTAALATNTTCAAGNAFYLDFAPPPSGLVLPARFALAFAKLADEGAASDVPLLGPAATILSGAVEPAPVVRTQFPSTGWVGQTVSYYLRGYHFLDGLGVRLEKPGSPSKLGLVSRLDRHRAHAEFVFTEVDTGRWDLVVGNAGGRETRREESVLVVKLAAPGPKLNIQGPDAVATMWVAPGAMPLTGPTAVPVASVTGGDPGLLADLEAAGVQTVRCMWPETTPQPTEAVQPDGSVEALVDFGNCFILTFESPEATADAVEALAGSPLVESVRQLVEGPARLQQACSWPPPPSCDRFTTPDDWNFWESDGVCGQWYLFHTATQAELGGCAPGNLNEDTQTACAWRVPAARGNSAVVIAFLDTGIDKAHPDLAYTYQSLPLGERILPGMNFAPDRDPDDVTDGFGHGTNMAGLAAARTYTGASVGDPNRGIAGVAGGWNLTHPDSAGSRILPVRVMDDEGIPVLAILPAAVNCAAQQGAKVLNMSLGFYVEGQPPDNVFPELRLALENAMKLGAVTVAAMGNDNTSEPLYPARFAEWGLCVAVGASDMCGARVDLGPNTGSNMGPHIDLVAPGVRIFTTHPLAGGNLDFGVARAYREAPFGTSLSTALVSGVSASLAGMVSELRDVDVKQILRSTAAHPNPFEAIPSMNVGWGRVDHGAAVRMLDPMMLRRVVSGQLSNPELKNDVEMTLTIKQPDDSNIPTGPHEVTRWEAHFPATFGVTFRDGPGDKLDAWVRVVGTKGWSPDNPHLFNLGWGDVVDQTLSGTGATFFTHLYQIKSTGQWVPVAPEQATLRYVAVGTLTNVTDVPGVQVPGRLSVRLTSNPTAGSPSVGIEIRGAPGEPLEIGIHDVSGRRLARIEPGVSADGWWSIRWDALDDAGRRVRPGLYFVRVRQGAEARSVKAVVLP